MSLIRRLAEIIDEGKKEYEAILAKAGMEHSVPMLKKEEAYGSDGEEKRNILAHMDNLELMKMLNHQLESKGCIKVIYVDPPFFSKADYSVRVKISDDSAEENVKIRKNAYTDTWNEGMESYLRMLCVRLYMMRHLLAPDGCIWVHLDWHAVHYVKVIMDEIFGEENFINEIIWQYKSGGSTSKRFARKHDTLLFYGKTDQYLFKPQKEKSYNREFKPYRFKGVEEFQDKIGWYTMVNMKDVWQIDMVGRTSSERTGYATQKPEALLERILTSCSEEGDLCADFFGGSGTLAAVAQKTGRQWITVDMGKTSVASIKKRMIKLGGNFQVMAPELHKNNRGKANKNGDDCTLEINCEKLSQNIYKITLKSYKIGVGNIAEFGVEEKARLDSLIERDSLRLIDYWSVDFSYDGCCHRPQSVFFKEKEEIVKTASEMCLSAAISVCCTDVFGNTAHCILKA